MNISLYQKFEDVIHNPHKINTLLQMTQEGDQQKNIHYLLDRVIKAAMSTDVGIKLNACSLLQMILSIYKEKISRKQLIKKIEDQSNQSNDLKKNEKTALLLGRFMLFKALAPLNADEYKQIIKLLKPLNENKDLSQHLLETAYDLCSTLTQQKRASVLNNLPADSDKDKLFKKCLLAKLSSKKITFTQQQIDNLILSLINDLPKHPIVSSYFIQVIKLDTQGWKKLWKHLIDKFGDQSDYNYKGIWVILDLFEHRVSGQVNKNIVESIKVTQLWDLWMNELDVLNKRGKEKAANIHFNIGQNKQLANNLIRFIHSNKIYLNNLHSKHPLLHIYKLVDIEPYLKELLNQLSSVQQDRQDIVSELFSIIHINFDKVSDKTLIKAINVFLKYHIKFPMGEKYVQMIWSILNMKNKNQKVDESISFNSKVFESIIGSRQKIGLPEQVDDLKDVFSELIPLVQKLPQNLINSFKSFIVNSLIFSTIWNQQIPTCLEYPEWIIDLSRFINIIEGVQNKPKKKLKKNKQDTINTQSQNKPIHILIEYFTSFLTKSPTFLRTSIEKCFQNCSKYYDTQDIGKLLAVVFRPDAEYIEEQ